MKKLFLTMFFAIIAVAMFAQPRFFPGQNAHVRFNTMYTVIDSLTLEQIPTPFPTEDNDYLMELPHAGKMIIAYNADRTKAKVLFNGTPIKRHHSVINHFMEYDVKDSDARLILYHKDDFMFCGYIYDKTVKACKYFEAINEDEKEKLGEKLPFIKRLPTFSSDGTWQ